MSIVLKRRYPFKPAGLMPNFSLPFFDKACGFWACARTGDLRNLIDGANDGTRALTQKIIATREGAALRTEGDNSGFYQQTLHGLDGFYTAPAYFTDIALVRAVDFSIASGTTNNPCGTALGNFRFAALAFPTGVNTGRLNYTIDATVTDISGFASDIRNDNPLAWDLGIIAGGSVGNQAWLYFNSCPMGRGQIREYKESGGNIWAGNVGGETFSLGHRPRSAWTICRGLDIYWAAHFRRKLSVLELDELARNPFHPWDRPIWIPSAAVTPGPVNLNIDEIDHVRPVDAVDLVEITVDIDIDGLSHVRPVDAPTLGPIYSFFVGALDHARPVDAILITPTEEVAAADLTHGRVVDQVDVTELVGVLLTVDPLTHVRPVDPLLLDVEALITIDGLDHARPLDIADVQPLLGDQTGMGATGSAWVLDAGQALINAASLDFSYHVLEGVFDSTNSILGVDGARVTGPAGMRELTTLTFGADVDGNRRVQGEIAELRIYGGALSAAERDVILSELQTKWITG